MNIGQLSYNFEYLLEEIKNKNQTCVLKMECLKLVHKYSMYFNGNKNYFEDYADKKMTSFGLLSQLVSDIINNLSGAANAPAVPIQVPVGMRIELFTIQELCTDLCKLAYE